MTFRILLSKVVGKQTTETDGSNSTFNVVGKWKTKTNLEFRLKNETGSSNSIFLFRRKTVGTKVHTL